MPSQDPERQGMQPYDLPKMPLFILLVLHEFLSHSQCLLEKVPGTLVFDLHQPLNHAPVHHLFARNRPGWTRLGNHLLHFIQMAM